MIKYAKNSKWSEACKALHSIRTQGTRNCDYSQLQVYLPHCGNHCNQFNHTANMGTLLLLQDLCLFIGYVAVMLDMLKRVYVGD